MTENWKPVENYSQYEVSDKGRLRKITTKRVLALYDKGGYLKVQAVRDDGIQKKPSIHRLVAQAFIPNPYNKPDIHHIDHNKHNNAVDNLMWVTPAENNSYNLCNFQRVINNRPKSVASRDYYEIHGALFTTLKSASKALKMPPSLIRTLCIVHKTKGFRYIPPKYY